MKQKVDNITIKAFYQRGIVLENGHAPSTIGELIEWIEKNALKYTLHISGNHKSKVCDFTWMVELKDKEGVSHPIESFTTTELIDALVEPCLKIQESK